MFNISRKKWIVLLITLFLIIVFQLYWYFDGGKSYKSISMIFEIEKKEHHIESGKYIRMWVIGSNANDSSPNKE